MATYFVDDAGSNTNPYDTWAKAATSFFDLDATVGTFAAGDIVYVASDHVDQKTSYAADMTLVGPTGAIPVSFISVTQGDETTYTKATANQINMDSTGHQPTFNGCVAIYGMQIKSLERIGFFSTNNCTIHVEDTLLIPGDRDPVLFGNGTGSAGEYINVTIDNTADAGTSGNEVVLMSGRNHIVGLSGVAGTNRTGNVFEPINNNTYSDISGDLSAWSNASMEIVAAGSMAGASFLHNIKTPATYALFSSVTWRGGQIEISNVGPANQPEQQALRNKEGYLESTTDEYRTGGGTVEGTNRSWGGPTLGIETTASCSLDSPFYTPWIPFVFSSTGSQVCTMHFAHNIGGADLTDAEIWGEVECKATATNGLWAYANDRVADRVTAGTAQADDTGSTWQEFGAVTLTYRQTVDVTAVPLTTGLARMRIGIAVASIAAADDLYIDPDVSIV